MTGKNMTKSDDVPTSPNPLSDSDQQQQPGPQGGEDSLDARTVVAGRPARKPSSDKGKGDRTVVYRPDHSSGEASPRISKEPGGEASVDPLESPTEALDNARLLPGQEDQSTGIYRPRQSSSSPEAHAMDDPPSGWLVVVAGPGKGSARTLRYGRNQIGRNSTERVPLDYGDEMISRSNHAVITYDPKGKKFYIQQGEGTNLVYVNGSPVLEAQLLEPLTHIMIGATTLRFIPLCGDLFDWGQAE